MTRSIHRSAKKGCIAIVSVSWLVLFGCGGGKSTGGSGGESGSTGANQSSETSGSAGSTSSGGGTADVAGSPGTGTGLGGSTAVGGQSAGAKTGGTMGLGGRGGGTGGSGVGGQGTGAGGTSVVGGTSGTGTSGTGADNTRLAGACQAGASYPAPVLTGTPQLLYKPSGTASNGTFEGPVWVASKSVLLFSDVTFTTPINPSQIFQLTPPSTAAAFMTDSGSNGMAVDGNGVVYACSHKVQGIVKLDFAAATFSTVVDNYQGKKFNSPNDLVLRSDGTIYFTDPDFQLGSRTSETGKKGVYRVSPSGVVSVVDDTFQEPNGITLSPDETVLYVADYNGNAIRTFKVAADGSTSGMKDFATVTSPDGLAVDCLGNLYVASGGRASTIVVFSPSGSKIASLAVGSSLSNLAFGGSDGQTLYITAGKTLYSLAMNLPGYYY
jgi:gluconolactonase